MSLFPLLVGERIREKAASTVERVPTKIRESTVKSAQASRASAGGAQAVAGQRPTTAIFFSARPRQTATRKHPFICSRHLLDAMTLWEKELGKKAKFGLASPKGEGVGKKISRLAGNRPARRVKKPPPVPCRRF
jgi:hypothetical protein